MFDFEFRPCPFCGGTDIKINSSVYIEHPGRMWFVQCTGCGIRTKGFFDADHRGDKTYLRVLRAWTYEIRDWNRINDLDASNLINGKKAEVEFDACPHCGSKNVGLVADSDYSGAGRMWYVGCQDCGCRTPGHLESNSILGAKNGNILNAWERSIGDWNRRTN